MCREREQWSPLCPSPTREALSEENPVQENSQLIYFTKILFKLKLRHHQSIVHKQNKLKIKFYFAVKK